MKLKLCLMLVFVSLYSWSQSTTQTFNANGTFTVPAGVTSLSVQAWGGGGAGGGANGAGLLFGRGAAGGGGGAYASAPISVTPSTVLNVVVAGQTAGTSAANGSTGGNSTITGFETSIRAAGGSGGAANIADGTPAGGIGGTIAGSVGTTRLAGVNGANGNSWSLLGIFLSSGAGGAGANSGGAGGAAVSSVIFGNAPGNAGSAPGGAGSGAINTALGTAQAGGAGGAGKIILSYNCPAYSIFAVVPQNVCASIGNASTVELISSASSLPVGNYVVTYNISSPSTTGLTANLTVSSAGSGTFTATGFSTVGATSITVTKLTSGSCSSNITSNNTSLLTVSPATVAGTVSGGTTINSGSTSGLLTLSGHTGTVIAWQSATSPFSTWYDIANTNTTYTSEALTETTQFRAVVQNGSCAVLNSQPTTVTVNAAPIFNLFGTDFVCYKGGEPTGNTVLGYSAEELPITYSIVWNSSPTNDFEPVTDAAFPTNGELIPIIVPQEGLALGSYTGSLTPKYAGGSIGPPKTFTVDVVTCGARESSEKSNAVTTEIPHSAENKVSVNSLNKVLNIDSSGRNINQVYVYDISGNLIYQKDKVSNPKLAIDNLRSGNQVLVVKVILDDNKVETKKVVY